MAESRPAGPDQAAAGVRDELLATKVITPRTRSDLLGRSRLIERLSQGMAREVVLVCTPAGFGKTTLLADWAASTDWPVAWLSLVAGGIGFLCLIAGCVVFARRFASQRARGWAAYSLATGAVFLAGFAGIASGNQVGWLNLTFGAAVVIAWVWVSAVCLRAGAQGS